jgi:hypothetical protein
VLRVVIGGDEPAEGNYRMERPKGCEIQGRLYGIIQYRQYIQYNRIGYTTMAHYTGYIPYMPIYLVYIL